MSTIAITGISGYVGKKLTHLLIDKNYYQKIIGVDINDFSSEDEKIKFYKIDIRDKKLQNIFKEEKVDYVIHLAFLLNPIHNKSLMFDINVNGTKNVLDASKYSGVKKFIYLSSTTVYGAHSDNPEFLTEESVLRPNKNFDYAYHKLIVENMINEFSRENQQINITIFRPCIIISKNADNFISNTIIQSFSLFIKGTNIPLQFVHEDDVARAIIFAIENNLQGIYNLAGNGTITTLECRKLAGGITLKLPYGLVYLLVYILWRLKIPLVKANEAILAYLRYRWIVSSEKLKSSGFVFKYTSEEAFKEFVNFHKKIRLTTLKRGAIK